MIQPNWNGPVQARLSWSYFCPINLHLLSPHLSTGLGHPVPPTGPTSSINTQVSSLNTSNLIGTGLQQQNLCLVYNNCNNNVNATKSPFILHPPQSNDMVHCTAPGCKICPKVQQEQVIEGYTSKKKFSTIRSQALDCKAKNLIYLITCNVCGQQYVGETSRTLAARMKEHRYKVFKGEANTFLVEHFKQSGHSAEDMRFAIIEHFGDNHITKQERESREDFWIRALVTAYPFGLNDKIRGYGIISTGLNPMEHKQHPYFCVKYPTQGKNRGQRKRSKKVVDVNKVKAGITMLESPVISPRDLYIQLNRLSNNETIRLLKHLQEDDIIISSKNELIAKAVAAAKLQSRTTKCCQPRKKLIITINYPNHGIEMLQLETIFKDHRFLKQLKITKEQLGDINIAYKYKHPIGSFIFNHNKTLRSLTEKELTDLMDSHCNCSHSPFLYQPLGHIITGDAGIIKDRTLQKLFAFGAKYRIPGKIDWDQVMVTTEQALLLLQNKLSIKLKNKTNIDNIAAAIKFCKDIVSKRLQRCIQRSGQERLMISLGSIQRKEIQRLQKSFIIAPADKASNNFIFICKKYYLQVMCQELGVMMNPVTKTWNALGNEVYKPSNISTIQLIRNHEVDSSNFGINLDDENKVLPLIYAVPKLHKNPYKFRFIAGACKSSVKPVSILLTKILKHIRNWFQKYCRSCNFNGSWSVNSSLEVLHDIKWKKGLQNLTTADFSSMYTSLPHDLIFKEISSLLAMLVKDKYFCVGYSTCYCTDNPGPKVKAFKIQELQEMVQFVLDNTFVQFSGLNFKQISGIPMGGNASPLLADLTLSMLEFQYMKQSSPVERSNMGLCWRYIDDILNINGKNFLATSVYIYPPSLPLEVTSTTNAKSNFLDLNIELKQGKAVTTLYNKVDAFNFEVIRMPHSSSEVHSRIGYNVFYGQLIRIARICSTAKELELKIQNLCDIFLAKGYDNYKLFQKAKQFSVYYKPMYLSFNISTKQMLQMFTQFL